MSNIRDFSSPAAVPSPTSPNHVNFDLDLEQQAARSSGSIGGDLFPTVSRTKSDTESTIHPSPIIKRRHTRANTAKSFRTIDTAPGRPNWHPGQEPGLDTGKANGGRPSTPTFHEQCQITVVDFSKKDMQMYELNNQELVDFVKRPRPEWVDCRWINVNGLSWDVIQALGQHKNLHQLAIEDMLNTDNRTKADWYQDHTYMVFTLQKLIHLHEDESDSDSDNDTPSIVQSSKTKRHKVSKFFGNMFSGSKDKSRNRNTVGGVHDPSRSFVTGHTEGLPTSLQKLRTLQRYHGGPNEARMEYMEKHSPLTKRRLAVSAEQVSLFLTSDNTVISFFESSADDIETPILHRLSTPATVLRRSCDASMLVQAIIDATIDLAMPVAAAYQDIIGDLELDVLTDPSIKQCTSLYIMTSEVTAMRNFVSPIRNLINALQDHKMSASKADASSRATTDSTTSTGSVRISPIAQTYLGDVEDHIVLITESLDQMRQTCDNMIDFIFNTISAFQNESMKQLTVVTIIFLPLTFLVGYFGQNFTHFNALEYGTNYFWKIAIPVFVVTTAVLMRDKMTWAVTRFVHRRGIAYSRKRPLRERKMR